MPIDDRTTNRSYKLPNAGNLLADDVQRLRDALTAIDADIFARYTKAEVDLFLTNLVNEDLGFQAALNSLDSEVGALQATVTALSASTPFENVFTGNGTQTAFVLTSAAASKASILVSVDGVIQPSAEYTLSANGLTVTLSEAPASGSAVRVLSFGLSGSQVTASVAITGAVTLLAGSTAAVAVTPASATFLSNGTSLRGVLGAVIGTLARDGAGAYTFAPLAEPTSGTTIPANTLFVAGAFDRFTQIGIGGNTVTDQMGFDDFPGYEYVITDGTHRIALAIKKDGTVYLPSLYVDKLGAPGGGIDIDSFDTRQLNIIDEGSFEGGGNGYEEFYSYVFTDSSNRIAWGVKPNGTLFANKVADLSISGTAGTAASLATARKLNGVDFNGTQDITIPSNVNVPTIDATFKSLTLPNASAQEGSSSYEGIYSSVVVDSEERISSAIMEDGTNYWPKGKADALEVKTLTVDNLLGATGQQSAVHSSQGLFTVEYVGQDPQIIRHFNGATNQITSLGKNYAPSLTVEPNPRVLFTSTRNGSPDYYVMNADGSDVYTANALPQIAVWGDSMSADLGEAAIRAGLAAVGAALPNRAVWNMGIGGQSSLQVALRMGALPWTAEIVGGQIPASGTVQITNHRTPLLTAFNTQYGLPSGGSRGDNVLDYGSWNGTFYKDSYVEIAGVKGLIFRTSDATDPDTYVFQRTTAGTAVSVTNPVSVKVVEHALPTFGYPTPVPASTIASYTSILWPFGPHTTISITQGGINVADVATADLEMSVVNAMIQELGSLNKKFLLLYDVTGHPGASNNHNGLRDRFVGKRVKTAYATNYPDRYFDPYPFVINGGLGVQSFKAWFATNYPSQYATDWTSPLSANVETEPRAVATVTLTGNGGSGVTQNYASVNTTSSPDTSYAVELRDQVRTGLRVGVVASGGVVTSLWVREGGIGYNVGDTFTIPAGTIGNASAITGTVASTRSEVIGTVRNQDGTVDTVKSYSQWDVDNGWFPRSGRRDVVHFNGIGGEYFCLLLAAKLKSLNW